MPNSPFDTGYGPSNLLLGSLNSFTQTQFIAHKDAAYEDTDFYLQDTWKVKHNLTFDYGLRLYHMPSQHELDPSKTNDATFVPSLWTAEPGGAPLCARSRQPHAGHRSGASRTILCRPA